MEFIHHTLLQWNDCIVRDGDVLGTNLRAAFGNVAIADAVRALQFVQPVLGIERVHLERGGVNQKTRADKLVVLVMLAEHMTHVLAQEALDALAEFLNAIDVRLCHPPRTIARIRGARLEGFDFFLHPKVPRHVGGKITNHRERLYGFDRYWPVERDLAHSGHAHQSRLAVDLRGTGTALAGLAIPAAGEVVGLPCLDFMDGIEHHHAFTYFHGVVFENAALRVTTPDFESGRRHFISSIICFNSAGISGSGSRVTCIAPSLPLRSTMLTLLKAGFLSGQSSRK